MAFSMPMSDLIGSFTASLSNNLANLSAHLSKTPYHILSLELLVLLWLPVLFATSYARYRQHISTRSFQIWNLSIFSFSSGLALIAKDLARHGWHSPEPYLTALEIYGSFIIYYILQKTIAVPPELEPTCDNTTAVTTLVYAVARAARAGQIRLIRAWNVVARRRSPGVDAFKFLGPLVATHWLDLQVRGVYLPLAAKLSLFLALVLAWAWIKSLLARKYRADQLRLEREERERTDGVGEKHSTEQGQVVANCEESKDEKVDRLGDV